MKEQDGTRFSHAMATLGQVYGDLMDKPRLRTYWRVLATRCSIEEFEDACAELLATQTDRHIPLPGVFVDTITDMRRRRRDIHETAAEREMRAQWLARAMVRVPLLADPREAEADAEAFADFKTGLDKLFGPGWREVAAAQDRRAALARRHHPVGAMEDSAHV